MPEHGLGWLPEKPTDPPYTGTCPNCKRQQSQIDRTIGQCFRCGAPLETAS